MVSNKYIWVQTHWILLFSFPHRHSTQFIVMRMKKVFLTQQISWVPFLIFHQMKQIFIILQSFVPQQFSCLFLLLFYFWHKIFFLTKSLICNNHINGNHAKEIFLFFLVLFFTCASEVFVKQQECSQFRIWVIFQNIW